MRLSRRQFNRGALMAAGAAAMPPMPVAAGEGGGDAYEAILREFFRSEEAARMSGASVNGGGAVSAVGRKLEGFIGHFDMTVTPFDSSAQVYRELRGYLKKQARKVVDRLADDAKQSIEASADKTSEKQPEPESDRVEMDDDGPVADPTSTNPVS